MGSGGDSRAPWHLSPALRPEHILSSFWLPCTGLTGFWGFLSVTTICNGTRLERWSCPSPLTPLPHWQAPARAHTAAPLGAW